MNKLLLGLLALVQVLCAFDHQRFKTLISHPLPEWMAQQISSDLAIFQEELSSESLDYLFSKYGNAMNLTRVTISSQKIKCQYSDASREHCVTLLIIRGLQKLSKQVKLPDVDLVFTSSDTIDYRCSLADAPRLPIFTESKDLESPGILFPDRWALKGYIPEKTDVMEGNSRYPWESKRPLLFFRGSDTARYHQPNFANWYDASRVKLVQLSSSVPSLIDAKFVNGLHNKAKIDEARKAGWIVDEFFPLKEHSKYKYLVDMDGNCASCPRTAAIFHSNSVVFKEVSTSKQWWYSLLQPYIHYIPISGDMSDVVEQILWAQTHDEECKQISINAQALVRDVLSEERIYQYLYELIKAYAAKQKHYY